MDALGIQLTFQTLMSVFFAIGTNPMKSKKRIEKANVMVFWILVELPGGQKIIFTRMSTG